MDWVGLGWVGLDWIGLIDDDGQRFDREMKQIDDISVVFLSHEANNTMQFAQTQLEWMNPAILQAMNQKRENVFHFKL